MLSNIAKATQQINQTLGLEVRSSSSMTPKLCFLELGKLLVTKFWLTAVDELF